jgi:quercetin dioxygenase-like cupin family protein
MAIGVPIDPLEPFMVTVEPGAGDDSESIVHPGQEFVYCLAGEIQYQIGGQVYGLKSGDSLLFEATQPHCFWNRGESPAQVLLIFRPSRADIWPDSVI